MRQKRRSDAATQLARKSLAVFLSAMLVVSCIPSNALAGLSKAKASDTAAQVEAQPADNASAVDEATPNTTDSQDKGSADKADPDEGKAPAADKDAAVNSPDDKKVDANDADDPKSEKPEADAPEADEVEPVEAADVIEDEAIVLDTQLTDDIKAYPSQPVHGGQR